MSKSRGKKNSSGKKEKQYKVPEEGICLAYLRISGLTRVVSVDSAQGGGQGQSDWLGADGLSEEAHFGRHPSGLSHDCCLMSVSPSLPAWHYVG